MGWHTRHASVNPGLEGHLRPETLNLTAWNHALGLLSFFLFLFYFCIYIYIYKLYIRTHFVHKTLHSIYLCLYMYMYIMYIIHVYISLCMYAYTHIYYIYMRASVRNVTSISVNFYLDCTLSFNICMYFAHACVVCYRYISISISISIYICLIFVYMILLYV